MAFLPVVPVLFGRRFDIFEPAYLFALSYGVLFVVRPLADVANGFPTISGEDPLPGYELALVIGIAGALAFFGGYYLPAGARLAPRLPHPPADFDRGVLAVYTVAATVVGSGLFATFIVTSGGIPALAAILTGRSTAWFELFAQPAGYLFSGLLGLAGIGVLLLAAADRWWSGQGLAAALLIVLSQMTFIASGGRIWMLPVLIAVFVLWHLRRRSRPRLALVLAAAVPAFLLGVMLPTAYRNVETRQGTVVDAAVRVVTNPGQSVAEFFSTLDTAMVDTLAVEVQYVPSVMPFEYGATYLEAVTRPIPRAIWPDKPREGDVRLMETIWPELRGQTQFTFSGFGEPYLNWGLPGVAGFFLLFGIGWRALFEWRRQPRATILTQAVFAVSLPFIIVYVRGGVGVDYQRQAIFLLPLLVGAWYARRRHRTSPAPAPPPGGRVLSGAPRPTTGR